MSAEPIILSIETALQDGSLCLVQGARNLGVFSGEQKISRTEELLESIAALLKHAGVSLKQIDLIAVSEGPGSFTGIRIGMATAQAFSFGIKCPILGVSVLEALAFSVNSPQIISAAQTVRNQIIWKKFERFDSELTGTQIKIGAVRDFVEEINKLESDILKIVPESGLWRKVQEEAPSLISDPRIINASDNVAEYVALYSLFLFKNSTQNIRAVSPQYLLEVEIGRN